MIGYKIIQPVECSNNNKDKDLFLPADLNSDRS